MAALRQQPEDVGVLVLGQADGASRGGGGAVVLVELGLGVEELREVEEGGFVEAELLLGGGGGGVGVGVGGEVAVGRGGACANVGGVGNDDDEGEHSEGES